jgi:hypothetical protein
MLGDSLRRRHPCGRGRFTDVVLLLRAEKGPEVHRELVGVAIVVGDGLGADFVCGTFDFEGAEDLGGIEQSVEHGESVGGSQSVSMGCLPPILAKVWRPDER